MRPIFILSLTSLLFTIGCTGCSSNDSSVLSDPGGQAGQTHDASPDGADGTPGSGGSAGFAGMAGSSGFGGSATGGEAGLAGHGGETGGTGGDGEKGGSGGTSTGGTAGTGGTGGQSNSDGPCTTDNDCSSGFSCQVLPNTTQSALELRCAPIIGPNGIGSPCTQNTDCRTGLCLHGKCSAPCTSYNDCTQAGTCQTETITIGTLSNSFDICVVMPCPNTAACDPEEYCTELMDENGILLPYCRQGNTSGDPVGTACTSPASCASLNCPTWLGFCTEICSKDSDCNATTPQACVDVFNNGASIVAACAPSCTKQADCSTGATCKIATDSAANKNRFICGPGWGSDPVGTDCSTQNKCSSGLCIQNYMNGQLVDAICTAPCVTGADCPPGFQVCSDVQMTTPSGSGTQTIRMCNHP